MKEENYVMENNRHAKYNVEINRLLMTKEEARERIRRIEQFASEGFSPLMIEGEAHSYLYVKQDGR